MQDFIDVEECEITVDSHNKIWINIDGICRLQIGYAKRISINDPIRRSKILKGKP